MHLSDAGFAQFTDHTGKTEIHCVPLKLYHKVTDT